MKAGDVIRTNAYGQIALLFADRTQVRVARNSVLVVKDVRADGGVTLGLEGGQIFARATRGGTGVSIETAAATAAIRGTDWTMSVAGSRTTLSVIEGVVELRNPQGAVTVREGESAAATLGSAPTKVVISGGDIREQTLFHLSLRNAFELFPSSSLDQRATAQEAARLADVPLDRRTAEDRVSAAEIAYERDGREAARAAIAEARRSRLTAAQEARLLLLDGQFAAYGRRYREAVRLFERAEPKLTGERRVKARYLAYYARSLADPSRAATPPASDPGSLTALIGEAVTVAFLRSPRDALALLKAAEPRFGDNPEFQASLADIAFLVDDDATGEAALAKAEALDPASPDVLATRAHYRARFKGDIRGALADAREVVRQTPGSANAWAALASLEAERGAKREAETAYRKAIALDPEDPVGHANYAIFLLGENRNAEAKAESDKALALDPAFDIGYLAKGTQQFQAGETEAGINSLLRATTANPTYGDGLAVLGGAYVSSGDVIAGRQSLELADRFDPRNPTIAQFRSALALDQYEADDAIRFAQDSIERTRTRGGDYTPIESTRDAGTTLGAAYRFLSLDAWARYYGDRVFDPFSASSYFDQALSGGLVPFFTSPSPVGPDPVPDGASGFASAIQGFLLDPLSLASSNFRPSFIRSPLNEFEIGGGVTAVGGDIGGNGSASFQSLGYDPLPYSLSLSANYSSLDRTFASQGVENVAGAALFGVQAGPYDRVIGSFVGAHGEGGAAFPGIATTRFDTQNSDTFTGLLGWSHTFGYRNVLNAAVLGTVVDRSNFDASLIDAPFFPDLFPDTNLRYDLDGGTKDRRIQAGLSHLLGIGDDIVLRYGGEFGFERATSESLGDLALTDPTTALRARACFAAVTQRLAALGASQSLSDLFAFLSLFDPASQPNNCPTDSEKDGGVGRVWLDARASLAPGLDVEGALFAERAVSGDFEEEDDETRLSPRIAMAWAPIEGQYLRAGFLRTEPTAELNTLAPVDVLGLRPDAVPSASGKVDTAILRWDSQWTSRFFTATEYQHQSIDGLDLSVPVYLQSVTVPNATIDRLTVTGNLWIGGGFGGFASYSHAWSRGDLAGTDDRLPFLPDDLAKVGLTFVSPERLRLTVAETYIGERTSNVAGRMLDDAFVTDVSASWETPDRHLAIEAGVFNIFGEAIEVAPSVPAAGRTVSATLKARF
ncbi:TonB-dependent receptor [Aureimonas endophytica]|uniref:TonB-dependent receptor n=1 Tax=Aureimonas endophytica TaxID=2027858 RepID=A0A917E4Q3_9HYPH|nr:TonB-dependent receptor [Aureimonas endophytica]